jgi:hypothetical protein
MIRKRTKKSFYSEQLSTPRPTPKLDDHPSSAVRDCIFNTFAATLHIGGRSSIRKLKTRHVVVTGTQLSRGPCLKYLGKCLGNAVCVFQCSTGNRNHFHGFTRFLTRACDRRAAGRIHGFSDSVGKIRVT